VLADIGWLTLTIIATLVVGLKSRLQTPVSESNRLTKVRYAER
jgi:hypothetical protein